MLDIRYDAFSTRNYVMILFPYHLGTLLRAIHDSKSRSHGWSSSAVATASHPSSTRRYPPFRIVLTDRIFKDVLQFERLNFRFSTSITRRDEPIFVTTDKRRKNSATSNNEYRINPRYAMPRERLRSKRRRGWWCTRQKRWRDREKRGVVACTVAERTRCPLAASTGTRIALELE